MNPMTHVMLAAAFVAGLAAAGSVAAVYDRVIDDPAVQRVARAEGVAAERAAWREARNRAEIAAAQRQAQAQAQINAADRKLADYRASERRRGEAIRRVLEQEKNHDADTAQPACDLRLCRLPDGVWDQLR